MTYLASTPNTQDAPKGPIGTRAQLAAFMRNICVDIRADNYLLTEPSLERGPKSVRIIASDWIFDALEDLGSQGIAAIIESVHAAGAGATPRALPLAAAGFLSAAHRRALREHGHAEIYCQKLSAAGNGAFAMFSASAPRSIDTAMLARAHMACCYALGQFLAATGRRASRGPLSERERECLRWVSEGKTTDEVALILGVSSNTVNSYIAHAIQKFGASNRAMAIAAAIRSGIV